MYGFTIITAMFAVVFDDCPTPATVGAPFSAITQVTTSEIVDEAVGACTVPTKEWHTTFDSFAWEYLGESTELQNGGKPEHSPVCTHLAWPHPLGGANFGDFEHDYAVNSGAATVPASYGYKLTKTVTSTSGYKAFPITNTTKCIWRVGQKLDEIDLIPIIYYMAAPGGGGS